MQSIQNATVNVARIITGTVGLSGLATVLTELGSGSIEHARVLIDPFADG